MNETSALCQRCNSQESEPGFAFALCATCRDLLARRPFPPWIIACGAVAALISLGCTVFSFPALRAGVAFERGQAVEKKGDFAVAASEYGKVVARFPDSPSPLARWGITSWRAGKPRDAVEAFRRLSGRKLSRDLATEVDNTIQEMGRAIK